MTEPDPIPAAEAAADSLQISATYIRDGHLSEGAAVQLEVSAAAIRAVCAALRESRQREADLVAEIERLKAPPTA